MTEIEQFAFGAIEGAPMVASFGFSENAVKIELVEIPHHRAIAKLEFKNAVITSVWFDSEEDLTWPLDIIGFDNHKHGNNCRFVLNCDLVEFVWTSDWPIKIDPRT